MGQDTYSGCSPIVRIRRRQIKFYYNCRGVCGRRRTRAAVCTKALLFPVVQRQNVPCVGGVLFFRKKRACRVAALRAHRERFSLKLPRRDETQCCNIWLRVPIKFCNGEGGLSIKQKGDNYKHQNMQVRRIVSL